MGVYEGRGQIARAIKLVETRWQETKLDWDDAASAHFEKKYLEPLEADLRTATTAMEHMAAVLSQVRRDCQ
jgi:hypothetical protein